MSAVKRLIEEYENHPAYQGHPWNPAAPAHYVEEPTAKCCACKQPKPVSELLRFTPWEVLCQECQVETAAALAEMQADIQAIATDWARNALPEPETLREMESAIANLISLWG